MNEETGTQRPAAQETKQYVFKFPHKKITLNVEDDSSERLDSMQEVKNHIRTARKEMLLAVRSLIDKRIRRMEGRESRKADETAIRDIPLD